MKSNSVLILLPMLVLVACAQKENKPELALPPVPLVKVRPPIEHHALDFDEKIYGGAVQVYLAGPFDADESVNVAIFFEGDRSLGEAEIMTILTESQFKGFFVVPESKPKNKTHLYYLACENGFDGFLQQIMSTAAHLKWPGKINSLILLAHAGGGEVLANLGMQSSSYAKQVEALGLFDALEKAQYVGIGQFAKGFKLGAKIYGGYVTEDRAPANAPLAAALESAGVAEFIIEGISSDKINQKNLVTECMPKFLSAIRKDPFIDFRCNK